jgi:ribonuclease HepT-like protein
VTKDPRVYLAHILERADRIARYTRDGETAFQRDDMTQDAVIRNFEVIGEAAKRVPGEYRTRHPDIPWQLMAGLPRRPHPRIRGCGPAARLDGGDPGFACRPRGDRSDPSTARSA